MKYTRKLLLLALFGYAGCLHAQNVGVNEPNPQVPLHIKGAVALDSVQTLAAAAAITITERVSQVIITDDGAVSANAVTYDPTPVAGQLLYILNQDDEPATFAGTAIPSTRTGKFIYIDGAWRSLAGGGDAGWELDGNAGTDGTNFLGTTDAQDLRIRTNNAERMRILGANGRVLVNTTASPAKAWTSVTGTNDRVLVQGAAGESGVVAFTSGNRAAASYAEHTATATDIAIGSAGVSRSTAAGSSGVVGVSLGASGQSTGVLGLNASTTATSAAVQGNHTAPNTATNEARGVQGSVETNNALSSGVIGFYSGSNAGRGVSGITSSAGNATFGVLGVSSAISGETNGVGGQISSTTTGANGVIGLSQGATGATIGTAGATLSSNANAAGIYGLAFAPAWSILAPGFAGAGGKSFVIDHPLDPANKLLLHYCTEGEEPLNIYSGNVTTDSEGFATVALPHYFSALNIDPRYQLTVIGSFARAIVKDEVRELTNDFVIQTDEPNTKVSWQITAKRNDKFMQYALPLKPAEQEKTPEMRGKYMHPRAYGLDDSMGMYPVPKPAVANKAPERISYMPAAESVGNQSRDITQPSERAPGQR